MRGRRARPPPLARFVGMGESSEAAAPAVGLAPLRVAEMLRDGEIDVIDVREDAEWEAGRVAGARRIPVNELTARAEEVPRDRPVVFYCRGGSRSGMMAEAFRAEGYDAHNMTGGLVAWHAEGLPLEPEGGRVLDRGGFPDGLTSERVHGR
jgi:rhodanese-related sulfurtransferase